MVVDKVWKLTNKVRVVSGWTGYSVLGHTKTILAIFIQPSWKNDEE